MFVRPHIWCYVALTVLQQVEGDLDKGVVHLHLLRRPGQSDYEYRHLYLDVAGKSGGPPFPLHSKIWQASAECIWNGPSTASRRAVAGGGASGASWACGGDGSSSAARYAACAASAATPPCRPAARGSGAGRLGWHVC